VSTPPDQLRGAPPPPTNTDLPRSLEMAEVINLIGNLYLQIEILRKHNAELQQKLAVLERR
jgi:hypothetical protein